MPNAVFFFFIRNCNEMLHNIFPDAEKHSLNNNCHSLANDNEHDHNHNDIMMIIMMIMKVMMTIMMMMMMIRSAQ